MSLEAWGDDDDGLDGVREVYRKTLLEDGWLDDQQAEKLKGALQGAVEVIKQWHNMGIEDGSPLDVWELYYENAPEMKPLRDALAKGDA